MGSASHDASTQPGSPSQPLAGNSESPLGALWQLIQSERRDIALVLSYGAAVGVLSLVVPIAAQSLVNTVTFTSRKITKEVNGFGY